MTTAAATGEEFRIFVERFVQFTNLWTIYRDLRTGHYKPSIDNQDDQTFTVGITMMMVVYAYFYSLIEDDDDSVNGFRVWRARFPEENAAISAVESKVAPFKQRLRVFRNRLGFHGSRSRAHEEKGFDLFTDHSGTEIYVAMVHFKSLGSALLAKENAAAGRGTMTIKQVRAWIDSIVAGNPQVPTV